MILSPEELRSFPILGTERVEAPSVDPLLSGPTERLDVPHPWLVRRSGTTEIDLDRVEPENVLGGMLRGGWPTFERHVSPGANFDAHLLSLVTGPGEATAGAADGIVAARPEVTAIVGRGGMVICSTPQMARLLDLARTGLDQAHLEQLLRNRPGDLRWMIDQLEPTVRDRYMANAHDLAARALSLQTTGGQDSG